MRITQGCFAFDSTRGWESVRTSFIVNRPKTEPKIDMTRTDVRSRSQVYSWKSVR